MPRLSGESPRLDVVMGPRSRPCAALNSSACPPGRSAALSGVVRGLMGSAAPAAWYQVVLRVGRVAAYVFESHRTSRPWSTTATCSAETCDPCGWWVDDHTSQLPRNPLA